MVHLRVRKIGQSAEEVRSLGRYWLNDWVIRSQWIIRKIRIDQGWVIVTTFSIIHLVLVTIAKVIADYDYIFII